MQRLFLFSFQHNFFQPIIYASIQIPAVGSWLNSNLSLEVYLSLLQLSSTCAYELIFRNQTHKRIEDTWVLHNYLFTLFFFFILFLTFSFVASNMVFVPE